MLDEKISNFMNHGSGHAVKEILEFAVLLTKCEDFSRITGHSFIKTPDILKKKHCIINIQNQDNLCFLYAILSICYYNEIEDSHNRYRPSQYTQYLSTLKYDINDFPMRISNITKFERENPSLRINVVNYVDADDNDDNDDDEYSAYTNPNFQFIYKSKNENSNAKTVNLLLVSDRYKYHYMGIVNLEKLLNSHNKLNNRSRVQNKWCNECLRGFRTLTAYDKHLALCKIGKGAIQICTMPKKTDFKFNDLHKTISPAYEVFADFESLTANPTNHSTNIKQIHTPIAAGFLMMPARHDLIQPLPTIYKQFFGVDCVKEFLYELQIQSMVVKEWYDKHSKYPMRSLTPLESDNFNKAESCYLCNKSFNKDKVADHCYFTGQYLGPACNQCNLARRISKPFLPVIFHNLGGYDLHHILKYAISGFPHWNLTCIPKSSEKFLSMTAYINNHASLRFIDSLQFMNASLDTLVSSLDPSQMTVTKSLAYPGEVLTRKGIYPYSFAKSVDDIVQCYDFPPKAAFYDELTQQIGISDEEYELGKQTWELVGCRSLKDYMMFYLQLDIYLLADVFDAFRQTALMEDHLDPLHYYSIPGLSLSSALKLCNIELELFTDYNMYTFCEGGIRGGMTFVNKHHVQADEDTFLMYVDVNNLYGWALSQALPYGGHRWILDEHELKDIINNLPPIDCDFGYLLDVDIIIPSSIHDITDDLPFAPVKQCPPGSKVEKLLMTHERKDHYCVHSALLKFYLEHGVIVDKVHRALRFNQRPYFKEYIDHNTNKRASTNDKFRKDYYKLKNNSLYGKTVENIRKRKNIRLCNSDKKLMAYASKPNFHKTIDICEGLVAALMLKEDIVLNKPVYVGQAVLDLAKLRMYQLQYVDLERYRNEFNCSLNIVAGDTDSFFLEIKNVDNNQLLAAMKRDSLLDTSNYPISHPLYSNEMANQIGLIKDESGGKLYKEWIFLRPKCYSLKMMDGSNTKKAKGIVRNVVRQRLLHEHYMQIYEKGGVRHEKQRRIGSVNHQLYTMEYSKVALKCNDDKRCWVENNRSIAYGHHLLE